MFEVIVAALKYLRGIPVDMTEDAVLAGELRAGSVVGLLVSPLGDEANTVMVDVCISEDGQGELIKPGQTLPLEGQGGVYHINPEWRRYLPHPLWDNTDEISDKPFRGANSGIF
ncbi:MAG: hypothetical protein V1875_10320 [Candidatus Altiarchaeota archaeon]